MVDLAEGGVDVLVAARTGILAGPCSHRDDAGVAHQAQDRPEGLALGVEDAVVDDQRDEHHRSLSP